MRQISVDYSNTENLIRNLKVILNNLEIQKENTRRAISELNDLENYHSYQGRTLDELEYGLNEINKDIENTEELIMSIDRFSRNVQETDERLAHKFKQDVKSYAKKNNIELMSELDKFLKKAEMTLDALGLVPGIGEVADGINGILSLLQGNWGNALISFGSMVPLAGDSLKGLKYLDKASDLLKMGDKAVDLEKSSKKISKATKNFDVKDIDFKIDSKNINFKNNEKKNFNSSNADVNIQNKSNKISKRPSWRQSEIDVQADFPDYNPQKSFIDGKEVPYGTKGSSRPDFYKKGTSIEVKNYKITTPEGRNRLIRNISGQVNKRMKDLPEGTSQTIIIDVRGQNVSNDVLRSIRDKILEKSNVDVNIQFKR